MLKKSDYSSIRNIKLWCVFVIGKHKTYKTYLLYLYNQVYLLANSLMVDYKQSKIPPIGEMQKMYAFTDSMGFSKM